MRLKSFNCPSKTRVLGQKTTSIDLTDAQFAVLSQLRDKKWVNVDNFKKLHEKTVESLAVKGLVDVKKQGKSFYIRLKAGITLQS